MPEGHSADIERIIANTINETARGDPNALAARIVAALAGAGYGIVPANGIEDTALGPQPFDKLTREMRPQDPFGDGRDWTFRTGEHGGDEPDCIRIESTRLWKLCERQSWRSIAQQGESTPGISAAWNRLGAAVARVLALRLHNQSV